MAVKLIHLPLVSFPRNYVAVLVDSAGQAQSEQLMGFLYVYWLLPFVAAEAIGGRGAFYCNEGLVVSYSDTYCTPRVIAKIALHDM